MEPILVNRDVEVHDIALFKWSCIWNAVTNYFVDTRAAGSREVVVVQWRGVSVLTDNEVMNCLIYLFSGHTRLYHRVSEIKCLSGNQTRLSYSFDGGRIIDWYVLVHQLLEVLVWLSILCVVRLFDMVRYVPPTLKRVRVGSHRSSIEAAICFS